MLQQKQLAELAGLRDDLLALQLSADNANLSQLQPVQARLAHSLQPEIWDNFEVTQPITREYAVILNDPSQDQIMLLVVLWPGQSEPTGLAHNHLTWAVVGVVQGIEENQVWNYQPLAAGSTQQILQPEMTQQLRFGEICILQNDHIIHQVNNLAPKGHVSISLHVYGQDLRTTHRQLFDTVNQTSRPHPNSEFISVDDFMLL